MLEAPKHYSTPIQEGCILTCTFSCSRQSLRAIIAKGKDTQNKHMQEG